MKNIINRNSKGEIHGYQELYWNKTKLAFKGKRKNDKPIGYGEYHYNKKTRYYII